LNFKIFGDYPAKFFDVKRFRPHEENSSNCSPEF